MPAQSSPSTKETQPPLSEAEEVLILKALIDRDEYAERLIEREKEIRIVDEQLRLADERLRLERAQLLDEKKRHLAALQALAAYRTQRRPRIWKILTFGIVGDKKDAILEAQIVALQMEISGWK